MYTDKFAHDVTPPKKNVRKKLWGAKKAPWQNKTKTKTTKKQKSKDPKLFDGANLHDFVLVHCCDI